MTSRQRASTRNLLIDLRSLVGWPRSSSTTLDAFLKGLSQLAGLMHAVAEGGTPEAPLGLGPEVSDAAPASGARGGDNDGDVVAELDNRAGILRLIQRLLSRRQPDGPVLEALTWAAAPDGNGVVGSIAHPAAGLVSIRLTSEDLVRIERVLADPDVHWQGDRAGYERQSLIDILNPGFSSTVSSEAAALILAAVNNRFHGEPRSEPDQED